MVLHGAWMIFLFQTWPPRFLGWESTTDIFHTTVLVVPRLGWNIEPATAGLFGTLVPLLLCVGGIVLGRRATKYWMVEVKTLVAVGVSCGLLIAGNAFLLLLLLCLEN